MEVTLPISVPCRTTVIRLLRRAVVFTHRWVAIITGVLIIAITLSGAIIVFKPELDRLLYPYLFQATPGMVPITTVVNTVKVRYPDTPITWIGTPKAGNGVYEVWMEGDPEIVVRVDPGTGVILGMNRYGDTITEWFFKLHYSLFIDELFPGLATIVEEPEEKIVGILGILLFIMMMTGIVVWWPNLKKVTLAFTVRWKRGWYMCNYDLHRVIGIVTLPILLLPVLTGIGYEFGETSEDVWYAMTFTAKPMEAPATLQSSPSGNNNMKLSFDAIPALVAQKIPDGTVTWIRLPLTITDTLMVYVHTPADPDKGPHAIGAYYLYLDQYSGAVLWERDNLALPWAGRVWNAWMWPLHIGTWGGIWTKLLYVIIGLAPTALAITGVYTWVTRTRARWWRRKGKMRASNTVKRQQPALVGTPVTMNVVDSDSAE